jgi:hypothetical protein
MVRGSRLGVKQEEVWFLRIRALCMGVRQSLILWPTAHGHICVFDMSNLSTHHLNPSFPPTGTRSGAWGWGLWVSVPSIAATHLQQRAGLYAYGILHIYHAMLFLPLLGRVWPACRPRASDSYRNCSRCPRDAIPHVAVSQSCEWNLEARSTQYVRDC